MKQVTSLSVLGMLVLGCNHVQSSPAVQISSEAVKKAPKFQVVHSLDGRLVQVGPKDEVVVQSAEIAGWYGNELPAYSAFYLDYEMKDWSELRPIKLTAHSGTKAGALPSHSFIDAQSKVTPYLEDVTIQHVENGEKHSLRPLRIPCRDFRYFHDRTGVFASNRKDGIITRVSDKPIASSAVGGDGYLAYVHNDGLSNEVIVIESGKQSRVLYKGVDCTVRGISSLGTVTLKDGYKYLCIDISGKVREIPDARFDATPFVFNNQQWIVGFRADTVNGKRYNRLVVWDPNGTPIPLSTLCPGIKSAVVPVEEMTNGKVLANAAGLLAVELSGMNNVNPNTRMGNQNVIKTYVLKLIP